MVWKLQTRLAHIRMSLGYIGETVRNAMWCKDLNKLKEHLEGIRVEIETALEHVERALREHQSASDTVKHESRDQLSADTHSQE